MLVATAYRTLFLIAAAPVIGSILLLAIARVTGAAWHGIGGPARHAPILTFGAGLLGLAQLATPAPDHLVAWMSPWAVALRGGLGGVLLTLAARRLRGGASVTFAAIVLAGYAVSVTVLAGDWMLGHVPGHPVSAVGMMLSVAAVGGAAATTLVSGSGDVRTRGDMALLAVAAALGLGYLAFMDFLIVWFGNLPARVPFYIDRGTPAASVLALAAVVVGIAAPIALLTLMRHLTGQRLAGAAVLVGLALFDVWWIGGGPAALIGAAAGLIVVAAGPLRQARREGAHG
ncbi:hypothetical protein SAMN05192583_0681 [Sphingomonas gellani]|uniref:Uncharacterized protein n=2 Tax=Sphingomonas gellani TaxID=1166340 RepID=A0A1H7ZG87_9SPHN|nr:hypothetical protein SAMN05192583_0681 [Sphingomonas gellani]